MLHGQTEDVSSRLIPSLSEAIVDALVAAGCKSTRTQVHDQLAARFNQKMTIIARMALHLNEVIGEEITSCELKAISMPYGAAFNWRTMEDGYDDGRWHAVPASESPKVLCTTELGLQKELKGYNGEWQREVLTKPKVALESLTNGMQLRDVRGTYTGLFLSLALMIMSSVTVNMPAQTVVFAASYENCWSAQCRARLYLNICVIFSAPKL
jgi:hypothetical protein